MNLQTQIPLEKQKNNLINYTSKVLLFGSCFVENIGDKLSYFKFKTLQNPFGILFHPLAIENLITNAINKKVYKESDIFLNNEQWHCFEAHSKLSHTSKEDLLNHLNTQIEVANWHIVNSSHIVITLGTAWTYRFVETDTVVANCHKIPQKKFLKELLSVEEITQSLDAIIQLIKSVNKQASVVFTVSPVRHLKDGFVENTLSKAHLITAIHQFLNQQSSISNLQSFYFPSFEIMMDELRDYRFYAEDMIHPNQTAVKYIWEKFKNAWISDDALNIMKDVDEIQKGLQHKPFNASSIAHKKFLEGLREKQEKLQNKFSFIKF